MLFGLISVFLAVLCFRRLDVGLSPRRHGFDPRSDHARFMFDKVALRHGGLPSTSAVPSRHCWILFFIHTLFVPERQTVQAWEPSKISVLVQESGIIG